MRIYHARDDGSPWCSNRLCKLQNTTRGGHAVCSNRLVGIGGPIQIRIHSERARLNAGHLFAVEMHEKLQRQLLP